MASDTMGMVTGGQTASGRTAVGAVRAGGAALIGVTAAEVAAVIAAGATKAVPDRAVARAAGLAADQAAVPAEMGTPTTAGSARTAVFGNTEAGGYWVSAAYSRSKQILSANVGRPDSP
jgi:hypothetical protein